MAKQIELTKGFLATVDDADYEFLSAWNWCVSHGYAIRREMKNGKSKQVHMHRVVSQTPDGMFTDHINGNRLDNRRENLRHCTHRQNITNSKLFKSNSSGAKGVYWASRDSVWVAQIRTEGKRLSLGSFKNKNDAINAYCEAAKKYHGLFFTSGQNQQK